MKKTIAISLIILAFLIIYFLQANFFSWFNIAGISPNLFVILILFISLYMGLKVSIPLGIIFGFFLDIIIGKQIGVSAIMFGIIAFIGGYFDKNFSKDSRITIMLMIIGSTAIYEIGCYIFNFIGQSSYIEILPFIKILVIEIIYNTIITIIIYTWIQKLGYSLEEIFKGQKVLTKYF